MSPPTTGEAKPLDLRSVGAEDLVVHSVDEGVQFRVKEYDGFESFEVSTDIPWH